MQGCEWAQEEDREKESLIFLTAVHKVAMESVGAEASSATYDAALS